MKFLIVIIAVVVASSNLATASVQTESVFANTCKRELLHANRTLSQWAENMETMVNESKLPVTIKSQIHNEANTILDLIEEFGERLNILTPTQLARDLVTIRKRSNKMALDMYLNTLDMRWPQNTLQIGVIVERVQQACLHRSTIHILDSGHREQE